MEKVVFDKWFSVGSLLDYLDKTMNLKFVTLIKLHQNRIEEMKSIPKYEFKPLVESDRLIAFKDTTLRNYTGNTKLIVVNFVDDGEEKYCGYLTNDYESTEERIIKEKGWRWRIENYFKECDFLGLDALPSIELNKIAAMIAIKTFSFCLVSCLKKDLGGDYEKINPAQFSIVHLSLLLQLIPLLLSSVMNGESQKAQNLPPHSLQNPGISSTSTVKISSLPIHILAISTSFPKTGMALKLELGPTRSNPGPILPSVAMDAEAALTFSIPIKLSMNVLVMNTSIYRIMNEKILFITSSGTTRSPSRMGRTSFGWSDLNSSRYAYFNINSSRTTLIPPAAEPALPPMNMSMNSTMRDESGHVL